MRLISDTALAAVTIWQEARGEVYAGKLAVAEVIRNRMKERYASDGTVAGTVMRPQQFSGWNSGDPNRIPSLKIDDGDRVVADCIRAWKDAMEQQTNTVKGALLYYAPALAMPGWARGCTELARIGRHVFLRPK
jgi:spore germination cell wall hydrolase CwlJ-like protein